MGTGYQQGVGSFGFAPELLHTNWGPPEEERDHQKRE